MTQLESAMERMRAYHSQTTIELSVRSRRFGTFRKAMQVEDAQENLERVTLKGAADRLKAEMEKWCAPKKPDPITAAIAGMVEACPGCGGMPSVVRFAAATHPTVCLACMNPACKAPIHTDAYRIEDERVMLAMWNHLCMVAREEGERTKEGAMKE